MKPKSEYIPYGKEWEAEMKKLSKDILIGMYRLMALELRELKEKTGKGTP
jgi:hypothetical protein